MLDAMGYDTGINIPKLLQLAKELPQIVGHEVPGQVAKAGLRAIQITGSVPQNVNYAIKGAYLEPLLNFHKVPVVQAASAAPGSFQDMVATAQKASVLVLVY